MSPLARTRRTALLLLAACQAPGPSEVAPQPAPVAPLAATPTPPATAPVPATALGDEWLVWYMRDGSPTTRWIRLAGDGATVVAERRALIVGEGARLWRIERKDAAVDVLPCDCAELADESQCKSRRRLTTLGLQAVDLAGGAVTDIYPAETGTTYGELFGEQVLVVAGGAGARLLIHRSDESFACGAHPTHDHGTSLFDVAAGKAADGPFEAWPKQLPDAVRRPAAIEIQRGLRECDEAEEPLAADGMFLNEASVALTGGAPRVQWVFAVNVTYTCSPDHMVQGAATSSLVPEAAPIGLAPLPAEVTRALASIGDATAVGWSHLALEGAARDAALASFSASPQPPWPPDRVGYQENGRSPAGDKLDEARRFTRAKDYPRAIAAFDAALALDASLAAAYSGRGYARLLAGEFAAARTDFDAALARDSSAPFQAAVHFNLGLLAEKQGDRTAARAAYTRSNELRPTKAARDALAALAPP